jgi:hypothetical protein
MVRWLGILLGTLRSTVDTHRELALENLALRQQLAVTMAAAEEGEESGADRSTTCRRRSFGEEEPPASLGLDSKQECIPVSFPSGLGLHLSPTSRRRLVS